MNTQPFSLPTQEQIKNNNSSTKLEELFEEANNAMHDFKYQKTLEYCERFAGKISEMVRKLKESNINMSEIILDLREDKKKSDIFCKIMGMTCLINRIELSMEIKNNQITYSVIPIKNN